MKTKEISDLITVIVPIYNIKDYVGKCIESILSQTYKKLQIILVDDGSTDGSGDICDQYALIDDRIEVIHKENGGLVSARKAGIENIKGEYTVFVDGDDWIDSDMYESLINEIQKKDADILVTGFYKECAESSTVVYNEVEEGYYTRKEGGLSDNLFFKDCISNVGIYPNIYSKLFKSEVIKKYYMQIDDRISYGEDAACVYSCIPFVNSVQILHKSFYHYRFRGDSIVHKKNDKVLQQIGFVYEHLINCYREHENYESLRKQLSIYVTLNVFRSLNYYMDIDDNVKIPLYMLPKNIEKNKKIVLYGAGMIGQAYEKQLRALSESKMVLWVDKMAHHYRQEGKNVSNIEDILNYEYDIILVAVSDEDMVEGIKKELSQLGIEKNKIYWEKPISIIDTYVRFGS